MGATERTSQGIWSRFLQHPWLVRDLLYGAVALYLVFFSAFTILEHEALETTAFDLGNMDQAVWNSLHGNPLPFTNWGKEGTRLAYHVDPILVIISPLYLIYSDPRTLLVFQSLVVALGALPIFWLAREKIGENLFSLAFPLAYLLLPALEAANLFDFHPTTLAATLLAYAFYFLEKRRFLWFFLFAGLTMACKEEMPLLIVMMGLYTLLIRRDWRVGLGAVALGCAWFFLAVYIIIPHYNPTGGSPYLKAYGYLGEGPLGILKSLLTRPDLIISNLWIREKFIYLRDLLAPLAFLSLLAPQIFLLSSPTLAINLLSTKPEFYTLEKFHYAAPLVPFAVLSALWGSDWLAGWLKSRWRLNRKRSLYFLSTLTLVSSLLYHHCRGFTPLARGFQWPKPTEHDRLAQKFIDLIPPGAVVSAQSKLNPHLSQRPKIYMFPKVEDAEFVLFDVTADSWPIHPNDQRRLFDSLISEEGFGILAAQEGYILLQRGLPDAQALPQEFYDFARVESPQISYPASVDFGGLLRFLGFDLRGEEGLTSLTLYWQPLAPLEEGYRIYPFFYDQESRIIEDTTIRPMVVSIWYPTSLWREGEVVRMETLPWEVGEDYDIGLGVVKGEDWKERGERLPAEVHPSSLVMITFDGGTAVRLMEVRDGLPQPIWRSFEASQVPHELQAKIGGRALLLGYDLAPSSLRPGTTLHLTLYWQALGEMEKGYTVFVHLLDGKGKIRGQKDSFPLGGLRPTTSWVEGEYLSDEYEFSVQPDAPLGEYLIEVGMYDASTGERLPVYDEGGQPLGDRILLPTVIEVVAP